ncbi:hypothetical protein [Aeropyrum camini]|uniref:hypothetical protein n=1 Tax=Aeropyrum camini TaxID=229980 RepID=UPI000787462F|nr:hypothetical protein [Aeropyrum camini]
MGERLILDAEPLGGRLLQLTVASPGGGLEALNVGAAARAYLLPINTDASTLARGGGGGGCGGLGGGLGCLPRYDRLVEVVLWRAGGKGLGVWPRPSRPGELLGGLTSIQAPWWRSSGAWASARLPPGQGVRPPRGL